MIRVDFNNKKREIHGTLYKHILTQSMWCQLTTENTNK